MKKFKTRSSNKIKISLFILLFILIFTLLSFIKLSNSHSKFVKLLLNNFSHNKDAVNINILTSRLNNLISTYSFKESKNIITSNSHKIYLYNTHNLEKYNDNTSIDKVTELLKDKLVKLGIETIKENKNTSELLHTGLSYYDISRGFLKDAFNDNYSYYLDIHRDSVKDTSVTINNKNYARIMFVLGLDNPNYQENKKILNKMNNYLNNNYPGISRGIYEKSGKGVDGVYNQDLGDNVILIELGGIDNNYEELNNSTEIVSLMMYYMIGDTHEENF